MGAVAAQLAAALIAVSCVTVTFCVNLTMVQDRANGKGYHITDKCIGCGACQKVCPQKCIYEGTPYIINKHNCLHCGTCYENCPVKAVNNIQ